MSLNYSCLPPVPYTRSLTSVGVVNTVRLFDKVVRTNGSLLRVEGTEDPTFLIEHTQTVNRL